MTSQLGRALGYESGRDHQEETAASKQPVLAELVLHTTMAGTLMPQRPHNKGLRLKTFVVRGHVVVDRKFLHYCHCYHDVVFH